MSVVNQDGWKKEEKNEAPGPKYSPKVRMGNWNEELILQEVYHVFG